MRALADKFLPRPRASDLVLLPAALIVGWVLIVALINSATPSAIVVAAVAATTWCQWQLLRRSTKQPVPLPAILIASINTVGVTGYLWYPDLAPRAAVSYAMPDAPDIYHQAAVIFATASASLFIGGMLAWSRSGAVQAQPTASFQERAREALEVLHSAPSRWMLGVAALPLLIAILAYTPSGLWQRDVYSWHPGPLWAAKLASLTATAGVALASLLASRRAGSPRSRHAAGWLLAAYALVMWAMGSRSLAFIPFMLLVMLQIDPNPAHSRMRRTLTATALGVTGVLLLQVPLALRNRPEGAGLAPYWQILISDPGSLLNWDNMPATVGNILFAVPLSAVTANLADFPASFLITSLNPLPGVYTDWRTVTLSMRLNAYTPTSAIGELANYGMPYLIGFFGALGWLLARVQAWNGKLPALRATLASIAGFGAIAGFALSLLQYNLRAGMRGVWYFLALSLLLHLLPKLGKSDP